MAVGVVEAVAEWDEVDEVDEVEEVEEEDEVDEVEVAAEVEGTKPEESCTIFSMQRWRSRECSTPPTMAAKIGGRG
jgi:hypothetical protein